MHHWVDRPSDLAKRTGWIPRESSPFFSRCADVTPLNGCRRNYPRIEAQRHKAIGANRGFFLCHGATSGGYASCFHGAIHRGKVHQRAVLRGLAHRIFHQGTRRTIKPRGLLRHREKHHLDVRNGRINSFKGKTKHSTLERTRALLVFDINFKPANRIHFHQRG